MKQLILASGSPARKELLEKTGVAFVAEPSHYEEDMTLDLPPAELAKHLSAGKARDVAARHQDAVVLGADTFVAHNSHLLGKPHTQEKAKAMLERLSGQAHSLITGFTIIDAATGKEYSEAVETKVYFRELSAADIEGYLAKENVLSNAGAYIIQGLGSVLIDKIDGSYTNVVGLPLSRVAAALKPFGINLL